MTNTQLVWNAVITCVPVIISAHRKLTDFENPHDEFPNRTLVDLVKHYYVFNILDMLEYSHNNVMKFHSVFRGLMLQWMASCMR